MTWMEWYNALEKPSWTPSPSTIGLIWQILYPIIVVSFGFVFMQAYRMARLHVVVGWRAAAIIRK